MKPNISAEAIESFLNGGYEQDIYQKELMGIRHISLNGRDASIIFTNEETKRTGKAQYIHKDGYKPFIWSKQFTNNDLYAYEVRKFQETDFSKNISGEYTHVSIETGDVRELDDDNLIVLQEKNYTGEISTYVRFKTTKAQQAKLIRRKIAQYGISSTKLINSFNETVDIRIKDGFQRKVFIEKRDTPSESDNPFYNRRITGSDYNLKDFFREGGVAISGKKYMDYTKVKTWWSNLEDKQKIILFLNCFEGLKMMKIFDVEVDVNYLKTIVEKSRRNLISFKIEEIEKMITHKQNEVLKATKLSDFIESQTLLNKVLTGKKTTKYTESEILSIISTEHLVNDDYNYETFFRIFNISLNDEALRQQMCQAKTWDGGFGDDIKTLSRVIDILGFDVYNEKQTFVFGVKPIEQYMIQTGRRYFKGVENYKDLKVMVLDIETKALKAHKNFSKAALFPQYGHVFQVGLKCFQKGVSTFEKVLEIEDEEGELDMLLETYNLIMTENPDIILTYNGESFDYPFMLERLNQLGFQEENRFGEHNSIDALKNLMGQYFDNQGIQVSKFHIYNQREIKLKVGGATENAHQTSMFGKNCVDTMFNVKRAGAINKSIPNNKLKDNIIHADLAREGRVYIDGNEIGNIASDENPYYFKEASGEYFSSIKELLTNNDYFEVESIKKGINGEFYKSLKTLHLYSDDSDVDVRLDLHNCTNVYKINFDENVDSIVKDVITLVKNNFSQYEQIVFMNGCDENVKFNQLNDSLGSYFSDVAKFMDVSDYTQVTGSYLVNRYLIDDLDEPYDLEMLYAQQNFLISKWLPTDFQKVCTMGTANVWKLVLAGFYYIHDMTIPNYEEKRDYGGGLLGMVVAGYTGKSVKIDYSSLYPSEFLQHCKAPSFDTSGVFKAVVKYALDLRLKFKKLKNKHKKEKDFVNAQIFDLKQLPLKLLINSFYGMLGAPHVSPFSNVETAEHITCSGRQHMRHLIQYFVRRDFKITYFHTDGANFVIPENIENYTYVGKGDNWLAPEGKVFTGVGAYVAEYNDKFMRGRMGVDIDDYVLSCINFAKGNFCYLNFNEKKNKYKVGHVGGTLVKKDQSKYITKFLDESLVKLLRGESRAFYNDYHDYRNRIAKREIINSEIATRKKATKSKRDYLDNLAKGGAVQPHMENAIEKNIDIKAGDWFSYINVGDTDGDMTLVSEKIGKVITTDLKFAKTVHKVWSGLTGDVLKSQIKSAVKKEAFEFYNPKNGNFKGEEILEKLNAESKFKVTFKENVTKKYGVRYLVEVEFRFRVNNTVMLDEGDNDAFSKYNVKKYLKKFDKAIEPLWCAYEDYIRRTIFGYSDENINIIGTNTQYGVVETPWVLDSELCMTSGRTIKGKESNQQDLDELLKVTPEELHFWKSIGMSPNNSFDDLNISKDFQYKWFDKEGVRYFNTTHGEDIDYNSLYDWISENINIEADDNNYCILD